MAKILISLPSGDVTHELTGDLITIGRTPDNKIQINHHSVSAHHAKLILTNGNYRLKDLNSTNRSCVNDIPVTEAELTGSCFLRFGKIECVYKSESPSANEQLFSQLNETQTQLENLMKARDLIHQQNQTLIRERDEARRDAESALETLADAKKKIEEATSQYHGVQKQFGEVSAKLADAQKQIDLVSRERDSLFESSKELQTKLNDEFSEKLGDAQKQIDLVSRERDSLIESNKELQEKLETMAVQLNEARQRQAETPAINAQQKAAARPKEKMNGSRVEDEFDAPSLAEEEEEPAGIGQGSASGNSAGRIVTAPPLVQSWLQRATKRKNPDEPSARPPNIPSLKLHTEDQGGVVVAPIAPPAPLKLVPPPNGTKGTATARLRSATNSTPQNTEIRLAWELLNTMRRTLHYFLRHQDELKVMQEMGQSAHGLTEVSQTGLLRPIYELAFALEALIRDLYEQPKNIGPSTLRTIGQSIDFLATLLDEASLSRIREVSTAKIFAVDDDAGILDTISSTMAMVHLNVTSTAQSLTALTMLSEQNYDLILLDVGLPQMNGMDLCSRVRTLPQHQKTPIVFLTGEATAQNRVQSTLNGGNDMIGKPFSVLELAVKSLTWIFKGQLGLV